jgi:lysozyme family protein
MSPLSFKSAVAHVLALEGGFVDHPHDPGGATNLGITQRTLSSARGAPASRDDVRLLTEAEAERIYRRFFWDAVRGDDLPAGLDTAVFDAAVHSGPGRAVRLLQAALGVPVDGIVGPVTLAAAAAAAPEPAIRRLMRGRRAMLRRLPAYKVFGRGWERRVLAVERQALRRARLAAGLVDP